MKKILLLGAGFSRNWGGWLAVEVFEYLLGREEIRADRVLLEMIWRAQTEQNGGGFEGALNRVQKDFLKTPNAETKGRLELFQGVLLIMFKEMNDGYRKRQFEFSTVDRAATVGEFITRFEAIYTLNQDLLIEQHYIGADTLMSANVRGRGSVELPGIRRTGQPDLDRVPAPAELTDGPWQVSKHTQPYIKLHGSADWRSAGNPLLILGGSKAEAIERVPLLKWYSELFARDLSSGGARLMTIGYGFGDAHINSSIASGAAKDLGLFVIDPLGAGAVLAGQSGPKDSNTVLEQCLIGASRRPLSSTFSTDETERRKIFRFFE